MKAASQPGRPRDDFAAQPVYRTALRLCAFVLDLETKFPDDERPLLYDGLKRGAVEAGSFLAAGFGRDSGPARQDLWERSRSRLMEARHHALVAQMRYVLDTKDVEAFDALYFELLEGVETLIGAAAGERLFPRPGRKRRGSAGE